MVSNVTREGPMTAQNDYRFQVTMTWNPPVYPYKKVESYIVTWSKESSKARSGFEFSGFTQTVSLVAFYLFSCTSFTTGSSNYKGTAETEGLYRNRTVFIYLECSLLFASSSARFEAFTVIYC